MSDNVISYIEMCQREGTSLQAGMNFGLGGNHSITEDNVQLFAPDIIWKSVTGLSEEFP